MIVGPKIRASWSVDVIPYEEENLITAVRRATAIWVVLQSIANRSCLDVLVG